MARTSSGQIRDRSCDPHPPAEEGIRLFVRLTRFRGGYLIQPG